MSAPGGDAASVGHHSLLLAAGKLADLAGQPGLGAGRRVHEALHGAAVALEEHFEIARATELESGGAELQPQLAKLEREIAALLDACWEAVRMPSDSDEALRARLQRLAHGMRHAAGREIALADAGLLEIPALD